MLTYQVNDIVGLLNFNNNTIMAGMNMPGPMAPSVANWPKQVEVLNELVELTGKEYFKPCELLKSGKWVDMK